MHQPLCSMLAQQCPLQQPAAAVLALVHASSAPAVSAVWPPVAAGQRSGAVVKKKLRTCMQGAGFVQQGTSTEFRLTGLKFSAAIYYNSNYK
jgi:hypothetical protein